MFIRIPRLSPGHPALVIDSNCVTQSRALPRHGGRGVWGGRAGGGWEKSHPARERTRGSGSCKQNQMRRGEGANHFHPFSRHCKVPARSRQRPRGSTGSHRGSHGGPLRAAQPDRPADAIGPTCRSIAKVAADGLIGAMRAPHWLDASPPECDRDVTHNIFTTVLAGYALCQA